jgi:hypothetical protein
MTTSSLIDHITTNTPEKISHSGVIHTGINVHSLVFAIRKIRVMQRNEKICVEIRKMKNFDEKKFIDELLNQHWDYVYFLAMIRMLRMWEIWKELFLEVLDKHAPLQQKKDRSNKVPWITSEIKNLINKRDKLKRKTIISKSEIDWINYKTSRNQINIELTNAKQNYYCTRIAGQKCNPKKLGNQQTTY